MKPKSKIEQRLIVYNERAKEIQYKLEFNHRKIDREILQADLDEYLTRISELKWVLNISSESEAII